MKNKLIISFTLLASVVALFGCEKDMSDNTPRAIDVDRKANVQWFNGTINTNRNYIYVNGIPVNGAAVAHGSVFPSHSALPTGTTSFALYSGTNGITIKDTLVTTTQVAQNFVHDFKTGSSYTIFTYDTITSPKRLIVDNTASIFYPSDNFARVRFLNLIYNPTTPPNVDIFSVNQNTVLASNLPVAALTGYFAVPANTTDTWQVRQTGTTTVLTSLSITTTTLTPKRFYTAVYRGSHRVPANRGLALFATN